MSTTDTTNKAPTLSISIDRKLNLGNFESAGVFFSVSGITEEHTEDDIRRLIDGNGQLAFRILAEEVKAKVAAIKGAN